MGKFLDFSGLQFLIQLIKTDLAGKANTNHTHGNIQNGGILQSTDIDVASGDKLIVTDSSDNNKIARTSIQFDGNTTNQALTKKGTFEEFLPTSKAIGTNLIPVGDFKDNTNTIVEPSIESGMIKYNGRAEVISPTMYLEAGTYCCSYITSFNQEDVDVIVSGSNYSYYDMIQSGTEANKSNVIEISLPGNQYFCYFTFSLDDDQYACFHYFNLGGYVGNPQIEKGNVPTPYNYGENIAETIKIDIEHLQKRTAEREHTHGNITVAGSITSDTDIQSGDKLVITDASDRNKVSRASISFDGSTTNQALTKKGTFETFITSNDLSNNVTASNTLTEDKIVLGAGNHVTKTSSIGITTTEPGSSSDDTTLPTSKAVWDAIQNIAAATTDAMIYKGTIAGGNTEPYGALTGAAQRGWTYKVSAAGKINGIVVEVGDLIICNADNTAAATSSNYSTIASNWNYIQNNIDGALFKGSNSFVNSHVLVADGTSGKVKDSGLTIETSVPSNALFTDTTAIKLNSSVGSTKITNGSAINVNSSTGLSVYGNGEGILKIGNGANYIEASIVEAIPSDSLDDDSIQFLWDMDYNVDEFEELEEGEPDYVPPTDTTDETNG